MTAVSAPAPGNSRQLMSSAALVLACFVLALAVHVAHREYLSTTWGYQGFTYATPGVVDVVVAGLLIVVPALFAPTTIERPSQMIAGVLFCLLYVPTVAITVCLTEDGAERYGLLLASFACGMIPLLLVARMPLPETDRTVMLSDAGLPSHGFIRIIEVIWWALLAVLIYKQGSLMEFSALDDVYDQRAKGAADSLFLGYTQTYFGSVLSPLLLANGLMRRNTWSILMGCAGSIVMYAIDAQKSVLFTPIMMITIHQLVGRPLLTSFRTPIVAGGMAGTVAVLTGLSEGDNFGLSLIVHRMLGLPAVVFSQYYELFSKTGYTWWSHVRGVSLFVQPPATFQSDPLWPKLGFIVGERVLGTPEVNANANLFAGDGAAAAGLLGVVAIGMACAIWLHVVDRCARGWNQTFAVLCVAPPAIGLTNGHLFTVLLSYGGFFFPLLFAMYKPRPEAT